MVVSDELFQLIRSLTKSEKRHFKLFASRHVIGEGNNYVMLFDAIDKQEEYDEKAIVKKFSGHSFATRISSEKVYLYKLIMKSLRAYHASMSLDAEVKAMLLEVEILFGKALFRQCRKILLKAKQIAYENDLVVHMLEINRWEEKIILAVLDIGEVKRFLTEGRAEERNILKWLDKEGDFRWLNTRLFLLLKQEGPPRTPEQLAAYNEIMYHPLMGGKDEELSYEAQTGRLNIHAAYYYATGDLRHAYESQKRIIELSEEHPARIQEGLFRFIKVLNNMIILCQDLRMEKEFFYYLGKMKTLPADNEGVRMMITVNALQGELMYYVDSGEFTRGKNLVKEIEACVRLYGKRMNPSTTQAFYYNVAWVYFGCGEYRKALEWLNKIILDKTSGLINNIYYSSIVFSLMVHFELGNTALLEYTTRSAYRLFSRKQKMYKFENIILNFIRRSFRVVTRADLLKYFGELKKELLAIADDPFERSMFVNHNIIYWLDSKITKRPFEEVVKQAVKNKL